jgi:hypothetical protein
MTKATGTVFKIFVNEWKGTNLYSIKLEGNDIYFGTGEKVPSCKAGDVVVFDYKTSPNGRATADLDTLVIQAQAPAVATTAATPAKKSGGENWEARAEYWANKDQRDLDSEPEYRYRSATFQEGHRR